jgi:putative ATPase
MLGAGGAGRAMAVEMAWAGAEQLTLITRREAQGREVAELVQRASGVPCHWHPWQAPLQVPSGTDLLMNATHLGCAPELEPVPVADQVRVLERALADEERGLGSIRVVADPAALMHLAEKSDGDVRKGLTALELAVLTTPPGEDGAVNLTLSVAEESIQRKAVVYDSDGDAHYDTASAFIKSIRGSDPDAALYWLAKMLHAGEDPRFISRRLVIAASEDIGLADSGALRVALDAHHALEFVGMPEGRIPLAHATVYLATAPKSNTAYAALGRAMADVEHGRTLAVPAHLRTPTRKKLAAASGEGEAALRYLYSHDFEGSYVPQAYLPEGRVYYQPGGQGLEKRIRERLEYWRAASKVEDGAGGGEIDQHSRDIDGRGE